MASIRDTLDKWFGASAKSEMKQPQREALVDALVFAMLADGEETAEEYEELMKGASSWSGETLLTTFVAESKERAKLAMSTQENAVAYCDDISRRLAEDWARESAYELAAQVVCSDGAVDVAERGLMSMFIHSFQISEAKALELSAKAHKKYDLL